MVSVNRVTLCVSIIVEGASVSHVAAPNILAFRNARIRQPREAYSTIHPAPLRSQLTSTSGILTNTTHTRRSNMAGKKDVSLDDILAQSTPLLLISPSVNRPLTRFQSDEMKPQSSPRRLWARKRRPSNQRFVSRRSRGFDSLLDDVPDRPSAL